MGAAEVSGTGLANEPPGALFVAGPGVGVGDAAGLGDALAEAAGFVATTPQIVVSETLAAAIDGCEVARVYVAVKP